MSQDEGPVVEYIDDSDNDVAAYYYSDEEADPLLKQKENTKKSTDARTFTECRTNNDTNDIEANKITAAENKNAGNKSSLDAVDLPLEDGELDEDDTTLGSNGVDKFEQPLIDILAYLSDTTKTSDKPQLTTRLAEYFGEPRSDLLTLAVQHLELGQLTSLVLEATNIERAGGAYTADGGRRRTFGGVFFHLMGKQVSKDVKKAIFGADQKLRKQAQLQRQKNQKNQANNRRPYNNNNNRGGSPAMRGNGGQKRKRENDADPKQAVKKQKL